MAVFTTGLPADSVAVAGITKLAEPFTARPAATVQVTVCPADEQPAGNVPMVKPAGIVSVIVLTAVVAALPVFCTASV